MKLELDSKKLKFLKASSNLEKKLFASKALKSRLYVSGWLLSGELQNIKKASINLDNTQIVLAVYDDFPIGVCVLAENSIIHLYKNGKSINKQILSIFVKDFYRRNGIGTKMIKLICDNKPFNHGYGTDGSYKFFAQFDNINDIKQTGT